MIFEHLSFHNEIADKFKFCTGDLAEVFFDKAIYEAKDGLVFSALTDAKFAYQLSLLIRENNAAYILGFISQLYYEIGKIDEAKHYYSLGLQLLDKECDLFLKLKRLIEK